MPRMDLRDSKNGHKGFHYELFFRLGIYIYIPPLQCLGGTQFPDPPCVSLFSLSLSIKFFSCL
jgi:hypothetical protein